MNRKQNNHLKITIIYDNEAWNKGLQADWGFSCLVQAYGRKILFDTGARSSILFANMKKLNIDPGEIAITEILISMERAGNTRERIKDDDLVNNAVQRSSNERNNTADMDSKLEKIFKLSDEALVSGNNSKALAYLKKAVQLFPDEQEAGQRLQQLKDKVRAENLVKIGMKKLSEGDIEKAITASRRAFDLFPDVSGLGELISSIEGEYISPPLQEQMFDQELELDDNEEDKETIIPEGIESPEGEALLWADRIRTAVKDDNFEEAGKMVAEAVRRHPDDTLLDSFYSKLKRLGFVKET